MLKMPINFHFEKYNTFSTWHPIKAKNVKIKGFSIAFMFLPKNNVCFKEV